MKERAEQNARRFEQENGYMEMYQPRVHLNTWYTF